MRLGLSGDISKRIAVSLESFFQAILSGSIAGAVVAGLVFKFWGGYVTEKGKNLATKQDIGEITAAVESVKREYASELEKLKSELAFQFFKRERAEQVAELLVEWMSRPEDRRRLNELAIKATMWLPDKEAKELNDLLAWKNGITAHQVISSTRRFVQDGASEIGPDDITLFPMQPNKQRPAPSPSKPTTLDELVKQARTEQVGNATSKSEKQSDQS